MGSRRQFGRSPGLCAVPLSEYGAIAKSWRPTPAQGDAAGREVGSGMPGSGEGQEPGLCFQIQAGRLPDSSEARICFAVAFLGVQARAGWGRGGVLWPQTVALPLPQFPWLSSLHFPVRSHWKLTPGAGLVLVSQGLSWPGGTRWMEQGVQRMARGLLEQEQVAVGAGTVACSAGHQSSPGPFWSHQCHLGQRRGQRHRDTGSSLPPHQLMGLGHPSFISLS